MDDTAAVDPSQPLQTLLPKQLGARGSHEHHWLALIPGCHQAMQRLPAVLEDHAHSIGINKSIQKSHHPWMSCAQRQHDLQHGVPQSLLLGSVRLRIRLHCHEFVVVAAPRLSHLPERTLAQPLARLHIQVLVGRPATGAGLECCQQLEGQKVAAATGSGTVRTSCGSRSGTGCGSRCPKTGNGAGQLPLRAGAPVPFPAAA